MLRVWDCLMADGEDLRGHPYTERRAARLEVLAGVPPPIQATAATDDTDVALAWYAHLPAQGLEGVVPKSTSSTYRPPRNWRKIRHAETVDAEVVGYVGPAGRPAASPCACLTGGVSSRRPLPRPSRPRLRA
ncbi:hypothetical protein [Streptomyces sp. NBC_01283]|uniref:ATP-dependent DNA ligase n=1 Tax=Streptomyces sp. NBC_01283 TaxID=2903812 RepID=UPI00352FA15E